MVGTTLIDIREHIEALATEPVTEFE